MEKKKVLTIEEMKFLEELGFDTSDASLHYYEWTDDYGERGGDYCADPYGSNIKYHAYILDDILDKLPQKVHLYPDDNSLDNTAFFTMNKMAGGGYFMAYEQSWDDANGKLKIVMHGRQQKDNAIDAAYNLLIWCKKNNFI